MARLAWYFLAGQPQHAIWRGNIVNPSLLRMMTTYLSGMPTGRSWATWLRDPCLRIDDQSRSSSGCMGRSLQSYTTI